MSKSVKGKSIISEDMYDIIQCPVITEKAHLGSEQNKFIFKVSPFANKIKVKKFIEAAFGVSVRKVNIIVVQGKSKTFKGTKGKRKDIKKAVVTLAEGQTIDITGKI